MLTIAIIIPIHNRLQLTQQGVQSLYEALGCYTKLGGCAYQFIVVVVDDGSVDGSSEWITMHYPATHILEGDGNLWWTGSVNKGAKYAVKELKANYIILWNDDTKCDINYFVELGKVLELNSIYQRSILASKIYWLNESNTLFNYGCYHSSKTGKKKIIGWNEKDKESFNKIIPIDWSGGMGTVIPADALMKLDYFDNQNFPQYHGDIDFFLRARKQGYKAYAIPTLKIFNNRDSTGLSKARSFSDLKKLFLSNRSNHNIRQNFMFNHRHANTLFSWSNFVSKYIVLTTQSIKTIVWP